MQHFNISSSLSSQYKSSSQKIRVLTEEWVSNNIYCPSCGSSVQNYENNRPVADFYCSKCIIDFELKSKGGKTLGKSIADGAYHTMLEKLSNQTNPNFFFLNYDKSSYDIINFLAVPHYLFIPSMIVPREKGIANRPNYIMCNIDISSIPNSGKVYYIQNGETISKHQVLDTWQNTTLFKAVNEMSSKGWLIDTILCIEKLNKKTFTLAQIYQFENSLKMKYPENNNIKAKIRQQLQLLRDKGFISFNGNGKYTIRQEYAYNA